MGTGRLPCRQAVKDIGTEIDTVGPYDRTGVRLESHTPKEIDIRERSEDASPAQDLRRKVDFPNHAVIETEFQAVLTDVANVNNSWVHPSLFYSNG